MGENTITAVDGFLAVKTRKAASCDEILPEMLKALNRSGVLWLTRVRQISWYSRRGPTDLQTGVINDHLHTQEGNRRECTN